MHWETMTTDEFASYKRDDGVKVEKVDGVWWTEVRPFFYRPLIPFQAIEPKSISYPPKSVLGGVLHVVPPQVPTGASINFHVYDDLKSYSVESLSSNRRKFINRGLRTFTDRAVTDLDEFVECGHELYKEFYQRTRYWYKSNRIRKSEFHKWAKAMYDCPKIDKTGVYCEGKLSALVTSFQIDDIVFGDNLITNNHALKHNVVDYVMHRFRESAALTDATYFFSGLPTGKSTLDSSKLMRGCRLLRLPAYCSINPFALSFARLFMRDSYHKLMIVLGQSPP